MAKVIKYTLCTKANHGTEDEPNWVESLTPCEIYCATQAQYDTNLPVVLKEAHNGEYTVEGEFEKVVEEPTTDDVLNALLGVTV